MGDVADDVIIEEHFSEEKKKKRKKKMYSISMKLLQRNWKGKLKENKKSNKRQLLLKKKIIM